MFNSMLDELKKVKHFNEIKRSKALQWNNRFKESYNVKFFKEIKRLRSLQKAEEYLEPKQASMMELFCKCT